MLMFLVDITLYCGVVRSNICVSAGEILICVIFINTSHRVIVWNLLVMVKITAEHWVKFVYFDLHASQKPHEGICLLLRYLNRNSSGYCLQSKVEITNLECWILTRVVFRYLCIIMVCMVSCSRECVGGGGEEPPGLSLHGAHHSHPHQAHHAHQAGAAQGEHWSPAVWARLRKQSSISGGGASYIIHTPHHTTTGYHLS